MTNTSNKDSFWVGVASNNRAYLYDDRQDAMRIHPLETFEVVRKDVMDAEIARLKAELCGDV